MSPAFAYFSKRRRRAWRFPESSPWSTESAPTKRCLSGPEALSEFTCEGRRKEHEDEATHCSLLFARRFASYHRGLGRRPFPVVVAFWNFVRRFLRSGSALRPARRPQPIRGDRASVAHRERALHLVRGTPLPPWIQPASRARPAQQHRPVPGPRRCLGWVSAPSEIVQTYRPASHSSLFCRSGNGGCSFLRSLPFSSFCSVLHSFFNF